MHIGYIYMTTCNVNGKKYIGLHKTKLVQETQHLDESYLGSGVLLAKALKLYGKDQFTTEVLQWCDTIEELNEAEIYYISLYNAAESENFYNVARGGEGHTCDPWNKGKHGVQEWTPAMEAAFEAGRHLPASEKLKEELKLYNTYRKEHRDEFENLYKLISETITEYFKEHPHCYMRDTEGNRVRVALEDVDEKLSLGWTKSIPIVDLNLVNDLYIILNLSRHETAKALGIEDWLLKMILKKHNIRKK